MHRQPKRTPSEPIKHRIKRKVFTDSHDLSLLSALYRRCVSTVPPNSRVQVTPRARPVTRGIVHARPVPSAVPFSMPASGAPDADRWAARIP
jgi:hypothetical protein